MRVCGVLSAGGEFAVFELPEPGPPGPGQLVLAVTAAGMGRWDSLLHTGGWDVGLRPPAALGVEGVGTVISVGAARDEGASIVVGDVVLAHEAPLPGGSGFWAERVLVDAGHVTSCPTGLDAVVAGALPVPGLTARQALDQLGVRANTRLLITGGSGTTAGLALQLAAQTGAHVVATAAPHHHDRLRQLGAVDVLDSHDADWATNAQSTGRGAGGFDAVLVAVTGTADAAISLLRKGGRLCSITSDAPRGDGTQLSTNLYVRPDAGQLGSLADAVATGTLHLAASPVALADAPRVARLLATGKTGGTTYAVTP